MFAVKTLIRKVTGPQNLAHRMVTYAMSDAKTVPTF
jgi:hypothetical protein